MDTLADSRLTLVWRVINNCLCRMNFSFSCISSNCCFSSSWRFSSSTIAVSCSEQHTHNTHTLTADVSPAPQLPSHVLSAVHTTLTYLQLMFLQLHNWRLMFWAPYTQHSHTYDWCFSSSTIDVSCSERHTHNTHILTADVSPAPQLTSHVLSTIHTTHTATHTLMTTRTFNLHYV